MNHILWLASWFPNRNDQYTGDFIERHAKAASQFIKLVVIVITKDENLPANATDINKVEEGNLVIYRAYYGPSGKKGIVEQIYSLARFYRLQKKVYYQSLAENGKPNLAHVHVAMKAGLLALHLKKKFAIPFIVTEHWSGYNPATSPNIYDNNRLFRQLNKNILKNASLFLPVSAQLGKTVNQYFLKIPYQVVPNVVDVSLFHYVPKSNGEKFRFIHPSFMVDIKNPEGILQACRLVKDKGYDFELFMVGNYNASLKRLSEDLKLDECVKFTGAVPYPRVAELMNESDALLMFSRYETLSCVIMEALCTGLPVVSSDVGGIPELLDASNGIMVPNEDTQALAAAMIEMMQNYSRYDRIAIANNATGKYSFQEVGKKFLSIYGEIAKTMQARTSV